MASLLFDSALSLLLSLSLIKRSESKQETMSTRILLAQIFLILIKSLESLETKRISYRLTVIGDDFVSPTSMFFC